MKNFLPYNLALLAHENGFNELCFAIVYSDNETAIGSEPFIDIMIRKVEPGEAIKTPLYQQILNWFIEKHNVHIEPVTNIIDDGKVIKIIKAYRLLIIYPADTVRFPGSKYSYRDFNVATMDEAIETAFLKLRKNERIQSKR